MSPEQRKLALANMVTICQHLDSIEPATGSQMPRMAIADIEPGLREDFQQFLMCSACPGDGYAYLHDFARWRSKFHRAAATLSVPLVAEEPATTVKDWNLVRYPNEQQWHLMGRTVPDGVARRTSFIEEFDLQNMRLLTGSGRLYRLQGAPCRDEAMEASLALPHLREVGAETWV